MRMKTPYSSYNLNGLPEGCKYCVRGEKLVLFISGKCSRACWYCSLSNKRKNKPAIYSNEREIKNKEQLIQEVKESNATSAGITGGDPILVISRTLAFARSLKKRFGKSFHIHIYLPTKLITKNKLKYLSKYIDEVRFHPEFLVNNKNTIDSDIKKISLAKEFWKKQNIGIELPMIPDKKKQILEFILKIKDYIGFVNLNEFELSETNMKIITRKYKLKEGGYVIKDSKQAGIWLLNKLNQLKNNKQKNKLKKLKVHFCTAELKNNFQFRNRLKRHKILKYGEKTKEGLVRYLVIENINKNKKLMNKLKKELKNKFYFDKYKNRIILPNSSANKLMDNKSNKIKNNLKIFLVEEFPTFDRIEVEKQEI